MNKQHSIFLEQFASSVIKHSMFSKAEKVLEKSLRDSEIAKKAKSTIVTGESGTGKTTLCKIFISRYPEPHQITTDRAVITIVPAFFCSVPSQVTIKSMAISILRGLGESDLSGDSNSVTNRAISLLRIKQTKLIVLDEFHHLLRSEAVKTREGVCDWVKHIINDLRIPIVICGLPKCSTIIREDSELNRRFPYHCKLGDFPLTLGERSPYLKILATFSDLMITDGGLNKRPSLTNPHIAKSIYCATSGNLDSICELFFNALEYCLDKSLPTIDQTVLAIAYDGICSLKSLTSKNPFDMSNSEVERIIRHDAK